MRKAPRDFVPELHIDGIKYRAQCSIRYARLCNSCILGAGIYSEVLVFRTSHIGLYVPVSRPFCILEYITCMFYCKRFYNTALPVWLRRPPGSNDDKLAETDADGAMAPTDNAPDEDDAEVAGGGGICAWQSLSNKSFKTLLQYC